ncbi:MAG: hypothetical protein Q4P66_03390 [Actinomycetaceae bacterium]|nr:hypothetical protein [Actinomycetaceae bacterium]
MTDTSTLGQNSGEDATSNSSTIPSNDESCEAGYGDPSAQFHAFIHGAGIVDLSHREVVAVSGPDRLTWLTTLSSQVVDTLTPGDSQELLLMDAQGHITFAAGIFDTGTVAYLLVDQGQGAKLAAFLESMKFMLRVDIKYADNMVQLGFVPGGSVEAALSLIAHTAAHQANVGADPHNSTEDAVDFAAKNPVKDAAYCADDATLPTTTPHTSHSAVQSLPGSGVDCSNTDIPELGDTDQFHKGCVIGVWRDPWPGITEGGTTYFQGTMPFVTPTAIAVVDVLRREQFIEAWLTLAKGYGSFPAETDDGYPIKKPILCGCDAWQAVRIANWRPSFATEVDTKSVPHELDWLRTAVHLHKGCYCGQETVARIVNLGRPPRRMVFIHIDGSTHERPQHGADIVYGKRAMGKLTSVVYHPEEGWIGLGVVRRAAPDEECAQIVWTKTCDDDEPNKVSVSATVTAIVSPLGKCLESPQSRPGQGLRRLPGASGKMPNTGIGLG